MVQETLEILYFMSAKLLNPEQIMIFSTFSIALQ